MNFLLHVLAVMGIYCILVWGYALIFRSAGMLSLAYCCYFAIGAYGYALGAVYGKPLWVITLTTLAVAMSFSLLEALLAWRLRTDFLFIGSLALQAVVYSLALNWVDVNRPIGSLRNLTNGAFGLPGLPRPAIFGIQLDTEGAFLALVGVCCLACFGVYRNLVMSPWGRVVEMSRDDEVAVSSLGKSGKRLRAEVLLIGAAFGALGGLLYAAQTGFVDPDVALLSRTISVLAMVAASGLFRARNPAFGAILLIAVPEGLRFVRLSSSSIADIQVLAYGLLLVGVAHAARIRSVFAGKPNAH